MAKTLAGPSRTSKRARKTERGSEPEEAPANVEGNGGESRGGKDDDRVTPGSFSSFSCGIRPPSESSLLRQFGYAGKAVSLRQRNPEPLLCLRGLQHIQQRRRNAPRSLLQRKECFPACFRSLWMFSQRYALVVQLLLIETDVV